MSCDCGRGLECRCGDFEPAFDAWLGQDSVIDSEVEMVQEAFEAGLEAGRAGL